MFRARQSLDLPLLFLTTTPRLRAVSRDSVRVLDSVERRTLVRVVVFYLVVRPKRSRRFSIDLRGLPRVSTDGPERPTFSTRLFSPSQGLPRSESRRPALSAFAHAASFAEYPSLSRPEATVSPSLSVPFDFPVRHLHIPFFVIALFCLLAGPVVGNCCLQHPLVISSRILSYTRPMFSRVMQKCCARRRQEVLTFVVLSARTPACL